jgi:hypothetical protein
MFVVVANILALLFSYLIVYVQWDAASFNVQWDGMPTWEPFRDAFVIRSMVEERKFKSIDILSTQVAFGETAFSRL